jgi:L,D-transpeptidase ErfK/SrfK
MIKGKLIHVVAGFSLHKLDIHLRKLKLATTFLFLISITANAAIYQLPPNGDDIIGNPPHTEMVQPNDNADKIMQRYELSYHELVEANPRLRFSHLRAGATIVIPDQYVLPEFRKGVVINIPELRLYYFMPDGQHVFTAPVGLGRADWRTPTMVAKIIKKEANPTWHVPGSIAEYALESKGKVLPDEIPPGPDNPLGNYAIYLSKNGYLMHGTNDPNSVGKYYSSGCMRFSASSIEFLFNNITVGTPIYIIHDTNKAGWFNNTLFLEAHVPVDYNSWQETDSDKKDVEASIQAATRTKPASIDWNRVRLVTEEHYGMPEPIGSYSATDTNSTDNTKNIHSITF